MTTASAFVPSFLITFDIATGTLTFTDTSTARGTHTVGLIKITHKLSGDILYVHDDWGTAPSAWTSPDIHGSATAVWTKSGIVLPTEYLGEYQFEYATYNGTTATEDVVPTPTVRTYTLDYTAPAVAIDMAVLCSTSELTSEDVTDYNLIIGGVQFIPTTTTRVHTLTKPAGSGCTISPLTWTDYGITNLRTIGGGVTAGSRIWTRTWQANIVTTLVWDVVAAYGATQPAVKITDIVYGDDNIYAQCDATICALAECYRNMLTRWRTSLTSNFSYKEANRDKVLEAAAMFDMLLWDERCGVSTENDVLALQTILAGENCNCTVNNDEVSVPIVPWGAIVAGGGTTPSEFQVFFTTTDPTDNDGHDGDVCFQTPSGHIWYKVSGSWVDKGLYKGTAGSPGADGAGDVQVLVNDILEYSTSGNTDATTICYDFQINNSYFENAGDFMEFVWDAKLAANANGKRLKVLFCGTTVLDYFTDDLVNADNNRVRIVLKATRINDTQQKLECSLVRGGLPADVIGPVVMLNGYDMNMDGSVILQGTNSVASASDIMCDGYSVTLHLRQTTLIPAKSPSGAGRGLVSQAFTATEGQTAFTVTEFVPNDMYIPLIDNVPQSQLVVTRSGYVFTYAPGLSAGQVLLIVD